MAKDIIKLYDSYVERKRTCLHKLADAKKSNDEIGVKIYNTNLKLYDTVIQQLQDLM